MKILQKEKIEQKERININFDDLDDVDRPTLGRSVDAVLFRVLKFSMLNYLGFSKNSKIYSAGKSFGKYLGVKSIEEMKEFFKAFGIGILEVVDENPLKIRIYECIDCSGLPNTGRPICFFEAGIIAGMLENILNESVHVNEVKCHATGHDYCEFEVRILKK
ncbi:V4R domain-containing protein [Methanotorris igneus]|uniref:4-vinyl reductase 4VR n=1 Tax=Methanotorris igneus (strain DSM 5666 / JCM 11834 / Kol 5) TaxID=880724 RepID=F6BF27_METIK|nr:V4R domain-containing protein [Methanotorris igneus]AEF96897.1 4-vinyl reductase 4VR [Methanotorris igneus Kol 5]